MASKKGITKRIPLNVQGTRLSAYFHMHRKTSVYTPQKVFYWDVRHLDVGMSRLGNALANHTLGLILLKILLNESETGFFQVIVDCTPHTLSETEQVYEADDIWRSSLAACRISKPDSGVLSTISPDFYRALLWNSSKPRHMISLRMDRTRIPFETMTIITDHFNELIRSLGHYAGQNVGRHLSGQGAFSVVAREMPWEACQNYHLQWSRLPGKDLEIRIRKVRALLTMQAAD